MIKQLIAIVLGTSAVMTSLYAEPKLHPQVSERIERAIANQQVRAVSTAVYDNGKIAYQGFGIVAANNLATPDENTIFEIGSISKVFTALLAQTQVDAGKLRWDDTLAERFPDLTFASKAVGAISLRELAAHRSGLPRLPDNLEAIDFGDPFTGYNRKKLLGFLSAFKPKKLKKQYDYSNLGAGILGEVAADAAGLSFVEATEKHLLAPLAMSRSGFNPEKLGTDQLAIGYSAGEDAANWTSSNALAGAGSLLSTSKDLMSFVHRNLSQGALDEALAAIREAQYSGETALGWHLTDADTKDIMYWHNGGTGGYASFIAYRPSDKRGFVLLSSSTDYDLITELGFAQMSGKTQALKLVDLSAYPGAYQISKNFYLFVTAEDDRLFAQATGQAAFPLTYSAENEFVFQGADIRIVFEETTADSAPGLILYQGDSKTKAKRAKAVKGVPVLLESAINQDQLSDYLGRYQLTPTVEIVVEEKNQRLLVRLSYQPAHPVYAYDTDKFFYKVVDAQLEFERTDGEVSAVILHQNGKQRAPRIE